mgnify:CR=1 FL=1
MQYQEHFQVDEERIAPVTSTPILSAADVEALAADSSPSSRGTIAEKIAGLFGHEQLTEVERTIAIAIFEALARDAEVVVRQRLAEAIKFNPDLPHHVAQMLAFDVIDVAQPILRHSPVLTDDDLIAVVGKRSVEHALEVAQRNYLSTPVSGALLSTGNEQVIVAFLGNKNAQISETTYHTIVDSFGTTPRIVDTMSLRTALPFRIVERLITIVTEETRERMIVQYGITPNYVSAIMAQGRQQLLLDTYLEGASPDEIEDFVRALNRDGLLSPPLILRAHCLGEFTFVWSAMARLARVPAASAVRLLLDPGLVGANQLFVLHRSDAA